VQGTGRHASEAAQLYGYPAKGRALYQSFYEGCTTCATTISGFFVVYFPAQLMANERAAPFLQAITGEKPWLGSFALSRKLPD
jgi:hypothetical protein